MAFALAPGEKRDAIAASPESWCLPFFPEDLAAVEALHSTDSLDAIVTDFHWQGGALADWIQLWPQPCVILVDPGSDPDRAERAARDESSLVLIRDPAGGHLRFLPSLVRKVISVRESLQRQNAYLQSTERQYLNLIEAIPDIVYTLDADGRFLYLNEAVKALGHDPAALVGRHFSALVEASGDWPMGRAAIIALVKDLVGRGGTAPDPPPRLFDERRTGRRMTHGLTVRLRRSPESPRHGVEVPEKSWGEVSCAGFRLPDHAGPGLGTIGIIRDVTERLERERALETALAARDVLLKEIHHRVKNNLQVVSSLLHLRELSVEDEEGRRVLAECETQVHSMAMVHELLYRTEDFEGVAFGTYLDRLLSHLSEVFRSQERGIEARVEAAAGRLGLDAAIPTALIATELISNAFNHAFPGGQRGNIRVSFAAEGENWVLEVEDDGVGAAGGAAASGKPPKRERGIGTDLVAALASQLHGSFSVESHPEGKGRLSRLGFPLINPQSGSDTTD